MILILVVIPYYISIYYMGRRKYTTYISTECQDTLLDMQYRGFLFVSFMLMRCFYNIPIIPIIYPWYLFQASSEIKFLEEMLTCFVSPLFFIKSSTQCCITLLHAARDHMIIPGYFEGTNIFQKHGLSLSRLSLSIHPQV